MANREFVTLFSLHVQIARASSTFLFRLLNIFHSRQTFFLPPPPAPPQLQAKEPGRVKSSSTGYQLPGTRESGAAVGDWIASRAGGGQMGVRCCGLAHGYLDRGDLGFEIVGCWFAASCLAGPLLRALRSRDSWFGRGERVPFFAVA
ncbi:uncharacterized protein K444DRAFT_622453 [Hyaloscypha bicolor E]|uniref:Uncharacterized protein n=1 Tax=Hyaloscypha bicolor E TaxID=1095630 RepID=A0A2J6SGF5_9HELO|nr:uncharacterized protein K444DRAFT_622453 [Hyaloscypha bicolor E]PMD49834.1 hypothetical protein K444DRAFT_622453 [Hyaloscypha bicolor E]